MISEKKSISIIKYLFGSGMSVVMVFAHAINLLSLIFPEIRSQCEARNEDVDMDTGKSG